MNGCVKRKRVTAEASFRRVQSVVFGAAKPPLLPEAVKLKKKKKKKAIQSS